MTMNEAYLQICNSFEAGRMAQAFIIVGSPRGDAGVLVEKCLQMIFCEASSKPCGECRGCRHVANRTHSDLHWVEPVMKSRIISVEQVRNLEDVIYKTSYAGGWKACVILGADRLRDSAANAFLKTLEEPPARTVFFLVTDSPHFLLPTIISRCQRITVSEDGSVMAKTWRMPVIDILKDLGSNRPAGDFALTDRMTNLLKGIKSEIEAEESPESEVAPVDDDAMDARNNARYIEERREIMCLVMSWFRDVYLLVSGVGEDCILNSDMMEELLTHAGRLEYRFARENLEIVEDMHRQLDGNILESMVLEQGFSKLN